MNDPFARLSGRFPELALSLYLPAGPALDRRFHHAFVKDLEREWKDDVECGSAAQRELADVKRYLDQTQFAGRPLAIFAYKPAGLFEVRVLPEDLGTILKLDHRFHLDPLRELLRRHPPALVAVLDRSARGCSRCSSGSARRWPNSRASRSRSTSRAAGRPNGCSGTRKSWRTPT